MNPARGVVIAKTSANQTYGKDETTDHEVEAFAVFKTIGQSVRSAR